MRDITVFLIHYTNHATLYSALSSLNRIDSRLKAIIVIQEQSTSLKFGQEYPFLDRIQFIVVKPSKLGTKLNKIIHEITTPYLMFLHDADYLSRTVDSASIYLLDGKTVLTAFYYNRNMVIYRPFLVSTSFLKNHAFVSNLYLPFKEAFFSVWLSNIEKSRQLYKKDLVSQVRKNSSTNTREKQKIIEKYQLEKMKTEHPTISILIANYNMEKYVGAAVCSCLLQNEQPEQLLIMDDGSTDNSYNLLKQWDDGKQVRVFQKQNQGKASALNDLLPHVVSDFILELDADDWLDPDAISVIKTYLSELPKEAAVMYGNLRKWKQVEEDVHFKGVTKGVAIKGKADLLTYRFPLGPRVYRTSYLQIERGFPVIEFEDGRLYEDVSLLNRLIKKYQFRYHDFTVYNVREHTESITKKSDAKWHDYLKTLDVD